MEVSADCKAAEGRVSLRRKTLKIEGRKRDRVLRGQSGWATGLNTTARQDWTKKSDGELDEKRKERRQYRKGSCVTR